MLLFLNDTTIILLDHIIYTKESSYYDSYMDINLNIYIVIYIVERTSQNTWLFHVIRYQQLIEIIDYLYGNQIFIIYVGINLPDFPGSIIVIALHVK